MKHVLCVCLISLFCQFQPRAEVRLAKVFSSNMVIQMEKPVPFWGWANPGEEIALTFESQTLKTTAGLDSSWYLVFPAVTQAGVNKNILVEGKTNSIKLENVLVGDVWLCGGQSNMDFTLAQLGSYNDQLKSMKNATIRHIKVKAVSSATTKKDIVSGGWKESIEENIPDFSATAFFFAQKMQTIRNIPIGLISDNWGGSPAEVWMSETAISSFPEIVSAYILKDKQLEERKKNSILRAERLPSYIKSALEKDTLGIKHTERFPFDSFKTWQNITMPGSIDLPNLSTIDGVFWLAKEFQLDITPNLDSLYVLDLGPIDDYDNTFINGNLVGTTNGPDVNRKYVVSAKYLKNGKNIIMIQLIDYGGGAGMANRKIQLKSKTDIVATLNGVWKVFPSFDFKKLDGYIEPDWSFEAGWKPSSVYNAMIYPLKKMPFKGVIWYQGESNAGRAYQYRSLFPALIADWRNHFEDQKLPFVYVQLANFMKPDNQPKDDPWPELREAQLFALTVPNVAMAVAIDIGEENDIHPKNKRDVGIRLALGAAKIIEYSSALASGPIFKSYKIEGNKIRLYFTEIGAGLLAKNGELKEFAIAGKNKKFIYANANIENNTVVVSHPSISNPVAVRYAWANNPAKANLYNLEGLPASPFRTDSWLGVTYKETKIE